MKSFDLPVLYEDEDLLVINKPAGVVVNRADTYQGWTVQDWLEERFGDGGESGEVSEQAAARDWEKLVPEDFNAQYGSPEEIFKNRLGMVHRLDKDTSGVLLLAKNPGALVNLLAQFKNRQVQKKYLCLVHGKFMLERGVVLLPVGRRPDNRRLFGVVPGGRPAATEYQVLKYYPHFNEDLLPEAASQNRRLSLYQGFSLVECLPKTGRTHQIRVHLQHLQHPIVGDSVYVGKKRAKLDALWCPRQFLHASSLTFTHPRSQKQLTVQAELLPDLKDVLKFVSESA